MHVYHVSDWAIRIRPETSNLDSVVEYPRVGPTILASPLVLLCSTITYTS